MTDTARTVAAIKALLADNSTQAISAQDLRDAIESIVDPVVDGGFDKAPPVRRRWLNFTNYNASGIVTMPASAGTGYSSEPITVPIDPNAGGLYANLTDPAGWWSPTYGLGAAAPRNSYSIDIPVGSAVMLDPGIYFADVYCQTNPALDVTTQWVGIFFDQAEYDPDFVYDGFLYPNNDGADSAWIYEGYYGPMSAQAPLGTPYPHFVAGQTARYNGASWRQGTVLANDTTEAKPFFVTAQQRSVLAETDVIYMGLTIIQLSGVQW